MKETWRRKSNRTLVLPSQALVWWHNLPSLEGQHVCLQEGELRVISSLRAHLLLVPLVLTVQGRNALTWKNGEENNRLREMLEDFLTLDKRSPPPPKE